MLFGLRFDLRNPAFSGVDMGDRYRAMLDMAEWADQRGGLYLSLSEHHGSDDGYLPSPLTMAAAVAARTENIRIGINAIVAPFYDPLRLAEDAAVVDQLSGGRLDLTLGGGYVKDEFDMFGVDSSERPARIRETVETLRAAWTGETFEFKGQISVGQTVTEVTSSDNSDLSEREFLDNQATDDGLTAAPKDFTEVSPE